MHISRQKSIGNDRLRVVFDQRCRDDHHVRKLHVEGDLRCRVHIIIRNLITLGLHGYLQFQIRIPSGSSARDQHPSPFFFRWQRKKKGEGC